MGTGPNGPNNCGQVAGTFEIPAISGRYDVGGQQYIYTYVDRPVVDPTVVPIAAARISNVLTALVDILPNLTPAQLSALYTASGWGDPGTLKLFLEMSQAYLSGLQTRNQFILDSLGVILSSSL